MYMLSYKGSKGSRTFQTHQTISECQKDADSHAAENSRLRGEYLIQKVEPKGFPLSALFGYFLSHERK